MNDINALLDIDFSVVFIGLFTLLFGFVAIVTVIEKISIMIKKPVKWVKDKETDHKLIVANAKAIEELSKKHEEDTKQSIRHDAIIRDDLKKLSDTMDIMVSKISVLEDKIDATEMAKLKEKILGYYRKYKDVGEWQRFESDVFWGLYDRYIQHGGNSFVIHEIEPVMRNLKVVD